MLPCSRDALVGLAWRVARGRGEGERPTSRRLFLLGTRFSANPVLLLDRGRQHKKTQTVAVVQTRLAVRPTFLEVKHYSRLISF
jgi:hypothetical protein